MIRAYHQPRRLDDALALVARGAIPLAGATALYSAKNPPEGELVDLGGVAGLDDITVEETRIAIGAMATLRRVIDAELPGMEGALLRRCARAIASAQMRNAITVGGNIAHAAFWADMPVGLLALGAEIEVARAGEPPRTLSLEQCFTASGGGAAWNGGLITRVFAPRTEGAIWAFGYERLSRTANDYALATACAVLRRDGEVARAVRLVIGALQPRPFRVAQVEAAIEGTSGEADVLERAAARVTETVAIMPSFRASPEYRRHLAGVLARRALETAFEWAMREA